MARVNVHLLLTALKEAKEIFKDPAFPTGLLIVVVDE